MSRKACPTGTPRTLSTPDLVPHIPGTPPSGARRMCLGEPDPSKPPPVLSEAQLQRLRERRTADDFRPLEFFRHPPVFERVEQVELRCVEVDPRHLTLVGLERGDCRFPYGGDV